MINDEVQFMKCSAFKHTIFLEIDLNGWISGEFNFWEVYFEDQYFKMIFELTFPNILLKIFYR